MKIFRSNYTVMIVIANVPLNFSVSLMTILSLFLANMPLHTTGSMGKADVRERALQACYCRA